MSPATAPEARADLRIRRGTDFRAVLREGRRRSQRGVVVYVLPTGGVTRAGVVCGRAVGGAVQRNRARRVLRESWRRVAPRIRSGNDVVLVARPEILTLKVDDMIAEIERALAAHLVMDA